MDTPRFLETGLHVLLEKEVSEYQLVLVDGFFGNDQTQGPLHVVFDGKRLVDFHDSRLLAEMTQVLLIHLVLTAASKCLSARYPGHEQLLRDSELIQFAGHVIFVLIRIHTRCPNGHLEIGIELLFGYVFTCLFEEVLGTVDEMREEITSVHEKVVLHGLQSVEELALVEDHVQKLLRAPGIGLVDVLVDFELVDFVLPRGVLVVLLLLALSSVR